jgi:hypothetical protein
MFFDLGQMLRATDVPRRLRTRIFYTSVLAILLHGCEHWRVTHEVETRLTKAHHGMVLSMLRLSRTRAAELHITRAEAWARTGAKDIMGLIERRWLRWGTKLMLMHRTAPSLPSIAFAGELFVEDYVWPHRAYHEGGTWLRDDGRRGRPLHWAWQYRELLVRCLSQQGDFGPAELDIISDNIIKRADYGVIEEVPLQMRAEAHVRCPHCNLLRNDQQDLVTHIDRCQSTNNNSTNSSSSNSSSSNSSSTGISNNNSSNSGGNRNTRSNTSLRRHSRTHNGDSGDRDDGDSNGHGGSTGSWSVSATSGRRGPRESSSTGTGDNYRSSSISRRSSISTNTGISRRSSIGSISSRSSRGSTITISTPTSVVGR